MSKDGDVALWLEDIYAGIDDEPVAGTKPTVEELIQVFARYRALMAEHQRLDEAEPVAAAYMNLAAARFDNKQGLIELRSALEDGFHVTLTADEGGEWRAVAKREA